MSKFVEERLSSAQIAYDEHEAEETSGVSLKDALSANTKIVVIGAPGGGKSTALERLQEQYPETVLILRIRDIRGENIIEEFLTFIDRAKDHAGIIAIDGLDESGSEAMAAIIQDLIGKASQESNIRWILTSRPADFSNDLEKYGFASLYIMPFNEKQIRECAESWFKGHEQSESQASLKTENFMHSYQDLPTDQKALYRNPCLLIMALRYYRIFGNLPKGTYRMGQALFQAWLTDFET